MRDFDQYNAKDLNYYTKAKSILMRIVKGLHLKIEEPQALEDLVESYVMLRKELDDNMQRLPQSHTIRYNLKRYDRLLYLNSVRLYSMRMKQLGMHDFPKDDIEEPSKKGSKWLGLTAYPNREFRTRNNRKRFTLHEGSSKNRASDRNISTQQNLEDNFKPISHR